MIRKPYIERKPEGRVDIKRNDAAADRIGVCRQPADACALGDRPIMRAAHIRSHDHKSSLRDAGKYLVVSLLARYLVGGLQDKAVIEQFLARCRLAIRLDV